MTTPPRKSMGMMSPAKPIVDKEQVSKDVAALPVFPYEGERSPARTTSDTNDQGVERIKVSDIIENPYNPRTSYLEKEVLAMAESLRKNGLMNPLHVAAPTSTEEHYLLIAGHTRLKAIRLYLQEDPRFDTVQVIVHRHMSARQIAVMAFEENAARAQQRPVDLGLYWAKLLEKGVFATAAEIAGAHETTETKVSRMLTFSKLNGEALKIILDNPDTFSHFHAIFILNIEKKHGKEAAKDFAERIAKENLSVREAEKLAKNLKIGDDKRRGIAPGTREIIRFSESAIKGSAIIRDDGEFKLNLSGLTSEEQAMLVKGLKEFLGGKRKSF
ncbi:hypothetical protein B1757_13615 [Acidithiobacillus marinus]|uniref:ParB-like N-terminal domain-containing protein n=1 Tax=Acidithiobacillus marinus TaxID=187490 RepID=A0A2I1DIE2_9PROT|nr:ParB/RepB/Spo0J family partition protein [Acidithiobacillus marinus]PKY09637.1 hypothetical protein B1757_13615 [Acidithiobacillus marinus]